MRHDAAYIQRGSMAVPLSALEEAGVVDPRQTRRRNPKGKKARKAAARLAAAQEAPTLVVALPDGPEPPRRANKAVKKGKAKARCAPRKPAGPEQLPAIPAAPLLEQRLVAALPLPSLPEPLVLAAPAEPLRLLTFDAMPELREEVLAHATEPEPLVLPAAPEPEPAPETEPAIALAALADAPLPRARALVPARRQGLIDVIAFLLRDSGRRLARWSARRHKTREEQAALRRAEARQLNLQRELEALNALQRPKV
ncbi:hypothetical protein [Novosphingobium sp.]|uniref:hypothetical protein n=1 Tax=Novosphingobium sp. TaxID=1874826 RepID=UPI002629D146|nr:hypothetical protein [Novosphingobium sp.]